MITSLTLLLRFCEAHRHQLIMHIVKNLTNPAFLTLVVISKYIRKHNEVGLLPLEARESLGLPYLPSASYMCSDFTVNRAPRQEPVELAAQDILHCPSTLIYLFGIYSKYTNITRI